MVKPRCRLDIRKFSFAHRIVDIWNGLDESIIACDSINGFKNSIDKICTVKGLSKFFVSLYTLSVDRNRERG